jgi:putative membrane protein
MNATTKPDSTQLALDRTWLAHERTLMAWVRTSASMISFGFTIYKFFQFEPKAQRPEHVLLSPRNFAVILVATGIITLVAATIQHRKDVKRLTPYLETKPVSVAGPMAGLISVLGVLALLAAIFRG